MTDQLELALGDRHRGQVANLAAGTAGHKDHTAVVQTALAELVREGLPFHADHVHRRVARALNGQPYDRNLVASAMGHAAHHGVIVEVARPMVHSVHRSRKGSKNRWWISQAAALREAS